MDKKILGVEDVQKLLGVGRTKAYSIISEINEDLKRKGMFFIRGKVSKKLLFERWGLL